MNIVFRKRKDASSIVITGSMAFLLVLSIISLNHFQLSDAQLSATDKGFLTKHKPYVELVSPPNDSTSPIQAIITVNDTLSNGYTFQRIPDGLGVLDNGNGTIDVFVNHELEKEEQGEFAKLSKIRLNQTDTSVIGANLIINGSEGYERFCAGYLVEGYGFEHPIFFTNEEIDDGLVLAIDAVNGTITEMPWLGEFSHENTVHIPYFSNTINKTVVLAFEDGDPTESEVYMYVSDSPQHLLSGNGQLYVFGASATKNQTTGYKSWDDIYFSNKTVNGEFIPLEWNHAIQNATDLDTEAISIGGFQFIRPEDGATDKRNGFENVLYMADTGNDLDEYDERIPNGSNGQNWTKGRMYKFAFTDPKNPTKASFEVMMDGNDPGAPGYNFLTNPDNVDNSQKSLMIQEDIIDSNRRNVTSPYDITHNAKIIRMDLANGNLESVAYLNQIEDMAARHGDWESSGITDVSNIFGDGSWLFNVQAHGFGEGGQILLMNVTES